MDNLFELVFWLIAIAIWLFSSQAKKKRQGQFPRREPIPERRPSTLEEKILESLGLKIPEAPEPQREPTSESKPFTQSAAQVNTKKKTEEIVSLQLTIDQLKQKKEAVLPALAPEAKAERGEFITLDKLEEGIILSVILGPPKAYTFQPGWRNWHSRRSQKPVGATS